jgi:hypothetical protein
LRVDALGRLGQPDHASILGFGIAEHDHAVAEHELSIGDSAPSAGTTILFSNPNALHSQSIAAPAFR